MYRTGRPTTIQSRAVGSESLPNAAHESRGEGLICQSRLCVAVCFFILLVRVGAAGEAGLDSACLDELAEVF
jgi:hypothetical protein